MDEAPSIERCIEAFSAGFESALNITLEPLQLSAEQAQYVEEIERKKYGNDEWTFRK